MTRLQTAQLRWGALALGPLLGITPLLLPPPNSLSPEAWRLVGLTLWMAIWWFSECMPIPATALLPLIWMPLVGIAEEKQVAPRYADPIIFLFLGGFILAQGIQASGLHERLALRIVRLMGRTPGGLVAGFMAATAFTSMWINNTSTTMMMFTVALSVVEWARRACGKEAAHNFVLALMLGIAYSASIGGVGTLIGTAPNALLAGFLRENYNFSLNMFNWLSVGIPFVLLMLPFAWLWLTRIQFSVKNLNFAPVQTALLEQVGEKNRWSAAEKGVAIVFSYAVLGWLGREFLSRWLGVSISDTFVAMSAALVLFILPACTKPYQPILDWRTAESIPWGVLILFGGGLALANAFESTGLAKAIGASVGSLGDLPPWLIVLGVAMLIIFLTELTSNTATTATFLPVVAAAAVGMGLDPRLLAIPVTVGASAAFMLPVATPPNAIVFASGEIKIHEMARAGLVLNFYCIAVVTLIALTTARWGLGIP
ncbi:MAG: di- and tricarboxylate transporter [Fimbriimonadales bacterium]|nr:MAG: di- and tricarboxylate transporter [Fimbriimonadales bacterium]